MSRHLLSVFEVLRDRIQEHPDQRLPSVRALCRDHHVSSREVVAALAELRELSLVETRARSGTWPKGKLPTLENTTSGRQSPSALAQRLAMEIEAGRFSTTEVLPSAKSLGLEWNCHPQTARTALRLLEKRGILERSGRSWRMFRPRSSRHPLRASILLVGASDQRGKLRMDTDREIEFWREISNEAARNGLETSRAVWTGTDIKIPRGTLGIVVSTWHVADGRELLLATRSSGLPVRTWQDGWGNPMHEILRDHPRLRVHDVALSAEAGREMGIHLRDRGFRRVAWISPFHGSTWSRSREAGLRQVLEKSGAKIGTFTLEAISEWDFFAKAWADPALWKHLDSPNLDQLTGGRVHPIVAKSAEQLGRRMILDAWSEQLAAALEWKADAWVGANDLAAELAREWLDATAFPEARPRGLAGFDDTSEAIRQDLTSYRFDTSSMARSMIRGILSHRRERGGAVGTIRHGGNVVPRGSTRT